MWEGAEVKKTAKLTRDEIKKQLIESIVVNEVIESDELNKQKQTIFKTPRRQQR